MPLVISDETLRAANMTEQEARIEIACRLFDAGKLDLWPAAQLGGLSRDEFVGELQRRNIRWPRYDLQDIELETAAQAIAERRKEPA
jgi:predicted HTH domain antitoxin